MVLAFSKTLKSQAGGVGPVHGGLLTRSFRMVTFSLRKRVEIGRQNGRRSFHLGACRRVAGAQCQERVTGAGSLYTLSEDASDEEAKALAAKENRSDIIAGVELPPESNDVTNILIDLAQRETKNLSIGFADTLLNGISE